jgi:hypothetical protein
VQGWAAALVAAQMGAYMTRKGFQSTGLFVAVGCGLALSAVAASAQSLSPRFQYQGAFAVAAGEESGRQAIALGDLDGDQRPDLVAINPAAGRVDVFRNQGDGTFAATTSVQVANPRALALADLAAPNVEAPDGKLDLLVGSDAGMFIVVAGFGDGTFAVGRQNIELGGFSTVLGIATGDFDERPGTDVAVSNARQVAVLCNLAGSLQPCGAVSSAELGIEDFIELASGDFDGDTHQDLALLSREAQRVVPLFGGGDASFTVGRTVAVDVEAGDGVAVDMAVTRLDGDALDDLVVVNRAENFQFLGAALFGRANRILRVQAFVADFRAAALAVADFDGEPDGGSDVIVGYEDRGLTVNVGDGSGDLIDPFTPVGTNRIGAVSSVVAGDLNSDGRPDLVVLHRAGDQVAVLFNASGPLCPGDCNVSGLVSIDELTRGVSIVLGERDRRDCIALDQNDDGSVTIAELIAAVRAALEGCPSGPQ